MAQRPLPTRGGLGPSRAVMPAEFAPMTATAFLEYLVATQRHRNPADDAQARAARFRAGEVRRSNGSCWAPNDVLAAHDEVWFYRMPAEETPVPGVVRPVYLAPGVMVVDKPPFLATMPRGRHITQTLVVRLRRATGNEELVPAHRLDRPTSGLVLCTTTPAVRGAYQQLFAQRRVSKTYQAIAPWDPAIAAAVSSGDSPDGSAAGSDAVAVVRHSLYEGASTSASGSDAVAVVERSLREGIATRATGPGGQHQVLMPSLHTSPRGLHVLQRMEKVHGFIQAHLEDGEPNAETVISQVERLGETEEAQLRRRYEGWTGEPLDERPLARYTLHPLSGKTHQLRLCLFTLGVPIVGDQVYPRILPEAVTREQLVDERWDQPLLLRSTSLTWDDPILGRPVTVSVPGF